MSTRDEMIAKLEKSLKEKFTDEGGVSYPSICGIMKGILTCLAIKIEVHHPEAFQTFLTEIEGAIACLK